MVVRVEIELRRQVNSRGRLIFPSLLVRGRLPAGFLIFLVDWSHMNDASPTGTEHKFCCCQKPSNATLEVTFLLVFCHEGCAAAGACAAAPPLPNSVDSLRPRSFQPRTAQNGLYSGRNEIAQNGSERRMKARARATAREVTAHRHSGTPVASLFSFGSSGSNP